jgi:hypothetical protein
MNTHVGLWIDHRRAVIVSASKAGQEIVEILSHANRESSEGRADDVLDRKYMKQLNAFYDAVSSRVHEASSLFILGPGEAKGEFKKRLEHERPGARTVHVETADKLTHPEIAAKVREHFEKENHGLVS